MYRNLLLLLFLLIFCYDLHDGKLGQDHRPRFGQPVMTHCGKAANLQVAFTPPILPGIYVYFTQECIVEPLTGHVQGVTAPLLWFTNTSGGLPFGFWKSQDFS